MDELASIRARFPRTVEAFAALSDGESTLLHVAALERQFAARRVAVIADELGPSSREPEYDVILAGGGLSLIYGTYLARAGLRVAIFDRRRVGSGHREWNISRGELRPLVDAGLCDAGEIEALVRMRYDHGIVRWHGGDTYAVHDVLDCVIDAERLLGHLRHSAERAGAAILDGYALTGYHVGRAGISVDLSGAAGERRLTGRVLIDGTGAASPHAAFDLVCPTVGGVLADLVHGTAPDEVDPSIGEILISTEGVEEGRQHIWEGFPAPDRMCTVYLFYYAEPDTLGEHPLLSLYERFFRVLGRYKRGPARLLKATYGYIPAYTRLRSTPAAPRDRVVLVGDAASRHSPLTFCGFGSMIRSFRPVADGIRERIAKDHLNRRSLESVWREPPGLRVMGALTLMMIPPGERGAAGPAPSEEAALGPDEINRLLDAAFGTLSEMGEDVYASFIRDEIGFRDFLSFLRATAKKRPTIYREVFSHLTPAELATWSWKFLSLAATKWRTG